jgi:hypothetical protein
VVSTTSAIFFGLVAGITIQFFGSTSHIGQGSAALMYLAGSTSGLALTVATLVFLVSGEAYHRAWANGTPPDRKLNRLGDILSGFGAIILGFGLLLMGQQMLAATSGLLHACGKFASSLYTPSGPSTGAWHYTFRAAVLASRLPGIIVAILMLADTVTSGQTNGLIQGTFPPLSLIICYLLWSKADLLLFPKMPDGIFGRRTAVHRRH